MNISTAIDTTALVSFTCTGETGLIIEPTCHDYFSVIIPYAAVGATEWHPRSPVGPFSTLTRGAFKTAEEAHVWAAARLNGTAYSLEFVTVDRWTCDIISADELASYTWDRPENVAGRAEQYAREVAQAA